MELFLVLEFGLLFVDFGYVALFVFDVGDGCLLWLSACVVLMGCFILFILVVCCWFDFHWIY